MFLAQWLSHGKGSIKVTGQLSGWREERPVIAAQGLEIEGVEIHGSISKRIEMILKCLTYVAFVSPFKKIIPFSIEFQVLLGWCFLYLTGIQ